jgi:hypothetical protein
VHSESFKNGWEVRSWRFRKSWNTLTVWRPLSKARDVDVSFNGVPTMANPWSRRFRELVTEISATRKLAPRSVSLPVAKA